MTRWHSKVALRTALRIPGSTRTLNIFATSCKLYKRIPLSDSSVIKTKLCYFRVGVEAVLYESRSGDRILTVFLSPSR